MGRISRAELVVRVSCVSRRRSLPIQGSDEPRAQGHDQAETCHLKSDLSDRVAGFNRVAL